MSSSPRSVQSILIIGASGRTGLELIRAFSSLSAKLEVHAFCRNPSKITKEDSSLCATICKGDARNESDIEDALKVTKANVVIVSIGNGDSVAKSDIRTASAEALGRILRKEDFQHVRVVVVSSTGASSSKIIVGFGIGSLISFHLRHVLKDHTGQEAALLSIGRTTIVRATALTDHKATGKIVEFGDKDKSPTIYTDREDLANWVVQEVVRGFKGNGNRVVNITGSKH